MITGIFVVEFSHGWRAAPNLAGFPPTEVGSFISFLLKSKSGMKSSAGIYSADKSETTGSCYG